MPGRAVGKRWGFASDNDAYALPMTEEDRRIWRNGADRGFMPLWLIEEGIRAQYKKMVFHGREQKYD